MLNSASFSPRVGQYREGERERGMASPGVEVKERKTREGIKRERRRRRRMEWQKKRRKRDEKRRNTSGG